MDETANSNGTGGRAVWYNIKTLVPNKQEELVLRSIVLRLPNEINNMATGTYSLVQSKNNINILNGQQKKPISSNTVVATLKTIAILAPDINSILSNIDNEAISFGVIGTSGKIGYTLTNNFWDLGKYSLVIDPLPVKYDLYINGNFVQAVDSNTPYNDIPELLTYVQPNSVTSIQLIYYVPKTYDLNSNPIKFLITASPVSDSNPNVAATVTSSISLGEVNLDMSYSVQPDYTNSSLFIIQYDINVYISKGVKVYDLQLKTLYSPSYILDSAYKDGIKLDISNQYKQNEDIQYNRLIENNRATQDTVISLDGQLIYPMISEVDAINEVVKIQYSYKILQYKGTPLSVGELMENMAILSGRTAINMEEKFIIKESTFEKTNGQDLTCAYMDQVFGRCTQYYRYENIKVPKLANYIFKDIKFEDPVIIEESLSIESNLDKDQFSRVMYKFNIPYRVIYQGCGCLTDYKEAEGTLEQNNIDINLYTPEEKGIKYSIVSESIVNNININEDKTLFNACIGVVTSSVGKQSFLVNNLKK